MGDKEGQTIDFLLTARRDQQAAKCFLQKAIRSHGVPEKIAIDRSRANKAAIRTYNAEQETGIELCQSKYLNNIVEQDIGPSSESYDLCWGSSRLGQRREHWQG